MAAGLATLWSGQAGQAPLAWGGLAIEGYPVASGGGHSAFELTLEALAMDGAVRCDFKFDSGRFQPRRGGTHGWPLPVPSSTHLAPHLIRP
ncbi:hypothetical protein LP420_13570 [Massilia sp. B-10]|nr:hypothetical protein LP420_13570 [Massilia sp. B-10]